MLPSLTGAKLRVKQITKKPRKTANSCVAVVVNERGLLLPADFLHVFNRVLELAVVVCRSKTRRFPRRPAWCDVVKNAHRHSCAAGL